MASKAPWLAVLGGLAAVAVFVSTSLDRVSPERITQEEAVPARPSPDGAEASAFDWGESGFKVPDPDTELSSQDAPEAEVINIGADINVDESTVSAGKEFVLDIGPDIDVDDAISDESQSEPIFIGIDLDVDDIERQTDTTGGSDAVSIGPDMDVEEYLRQAELDVEYIDIGDDISVPE